MSNRNKYEKAKDHAPKDTLMPILFGILRQVYTCPTSNCLTSAKHKYNIVKHLKSYYEICKKRRVRRKAKKSDPERQIH